MKNERNKYLYSYNAKEEEGSYVMIKIRYLIMAAEYPQMAEGYRAVSEWGGVWKESDILKEKEEIKKELRAIEEKYANVRFMGGDVIKTEDDLMRTSIDQDVILVYSPHPCISLFSLLLEFKKPIIWFLKWKKKPFYGQNLFGHFISVLARETKAENLVTVIWDDYDWLLEKIRALNAFVKLKDTKILCIGRPVTWIGGRMAGLASDAAVKLAKEKTEVDVEFVPLRDFIDEFKRMKPTDEAKEIARKFLDNAKEVRELTYDGAVKAVMVYLLLRKMMKERDANALTVNCYATDLIDRIDSAPCFAISRFNDEGTVSACEADFPALINMLMVSYIADKPVFQGDPVINPRTSLVLNAHCLAPTKLEGYTAEPEPYIATTHYESRKGATPEVIMRKGQDVTLTFLSADLSTLIVGKGKIVNVDMKYPICRTQIEISVENGSKFWKETTERLPFYTHMINVYGDYRKELEYLCTLLNIKFIST